MLLLFKTRAGFALFKVLDEGKLPKVEDLGKEFSSPDSARKVVKLKAFCKFENTSEALEAATKLIENSTGEGLRKFLRAHCDGEILAVADSKLGDAIKDKLNIECVHNDTVMELMSGVGSQLPELISGLAAQDLAPMSLGLSHSLSRHNLKFSPNKVDTMIIHAIGLLDDLDKDLNTYGMRFQEWYGWHFPELAKIISDNILYAKAVKLMGSRDNAAKLDFSEMLPEEVEAELKEAAMISMGREISEIDLINIEELCDWVLSLAEYRAHLHDYLKSRMNTIAPNLTALVGELVGARLIAHGGGLLNLAKQPGSTVRILGAGKPAIPKYGLLNHASLVGQAPPKMKGKMSRSLAAKAALAIRYDAFCDAQDNSMGLKDRLKLEARLRSLERKELGCSAGSAKGKLKIEAYDKDRKKGAGGLRTPAKAYNPSADAVHGQTPNSTTHKIEAESSPTEEPAIESPVTGEKKKDKKKKKTEEETVVSDNRNGTAEDGEGEAKKGKKKKKKNQAENDGEQKDAEVIDDGERKEKKRKNAEAEQEDESKMPSKEKKKRKRSRD